jgi:acyl-CoA synthetase (AMP-forming)/AMP-acid ligase II
VLVDRAKDLIITGGLNVYPSDVEAVLLKHAGVEEAAVVGEHSAQLGERPVAFVVARSGQAPDERALLAWANARLGKAQRLAGLRIVAQIPRSPVGKVLKRELRAQLARSA